MKGARQKPESGLVRGKASEVIWIRWQRALEGIAWSVGFVLRAKGHLRWVFNGKMTI